MVGNALVPSGVVSGDYSFYFFIYKEDLKLFKKFVYSKGIPSFGKDFSDCFVNYMVNSYYYSYRSNRYKCLSPSFKFIISEQYRVGKLGGCLDKFFSVVSLLFRKGFIDFFTVPNRLLPKLEFLDISDFCFKNKYRDEISDLKNNVVLLRVSVSDGLISFFEHLSGVINSNAFCRITHFDNVDWFVRFVKDFKSKKGIDLDSYVTKSLVGIANTDWDSFEASLKNPKAYNIQKLP